MNCKNCHTQLTSESYYCNSCGGKIIRNRLTIKNLFEHFTETFFNYDNKLLRTFLNLFNKPEDVIVGYINGTRKKYVNVISYFALAITLAGIQILVIQKFQTDITFYDTSTEMGKAQQKMFENIYKFTTDYQSLVMMLYIPFYALLAKIIFLRNKKFNYTELLVCFLYTQAQTSICIAIATCTLIPLNIVSFQTIGFIIMPLQFVYFTYCLKRIYELDSFQMLKKTLLFILILFIIFILVTIIGGIIAYKSGVFDAMIEAKKAAAEAAKQIQ